MSKTCSTLDEVLSQMNVMSSVNIFNFNLPLHVVPCFSLPWLRPSRSPTPFPFPTLLTSVSCPSGRYKEERANESTTLIDDNNGCLLALGAVDGAWVGWGTCNE